MTTEPYNHGEFCWADLATPDLTAAKAFYARVFGWNYRDVDTDCGVYTFAQLDGEDICGLYQQPPAQIDSGMGACWTSYVAVDDTDTSVATAASLGGTILFAPFEVADHGRMAVIADPQGAALSLWQRRGAHRGYARLGPIDGMPGWHELATSDLTAAEAFYGKLFGWGVRLTDMGDHLYAEWLVDHQPVAGALPIGADWGSVPPHWLVYFTISDCENTVATACSSGSSLCRPAIDVPDVGRVAVLRDPNGAAFAVIALQQV